jgi:hypothetical protein
MLQSRINTAMSDNLLPTSGWFPVQVFCKTARGPSPLSPFVRAHVTRLPHPQKSARPMTADHFDESLPSESHSDFVTEKSFPALTLNQPDHAALVRKVHGKLRLLMLVVERLPRDFTPYAHVPEYRLTYYIETLECGHKVVSYPQCGPPTKRRNCGVCALAASLPEKKPAVSVGVTEQEKQA